MEFGSDTKITHLLKVCKRKPQVCDVFFGPPFGDPGFLPVIVGMQRYNRIREILDERGIKNKFLVDKLDVSSGAVSKWCTNRAQPRVEMLFRIAKVLDVKVCALLVEDAEVE